MRTIKKDFFKRKINTKKTEIAFFQYMLLNTPYINNGQKEELQKYFIKRKTILSFTTKNICLKSGLEKSIISDFKISRHIFKKNALAGFLPGIRKSSW